MAAASLRTLAILVVLAGTLVFNNDVVVMVSAQCGGSIPDMVSQCEQYVQKTGPTIPPSPACCTELRKFDVNCMCQYITSDIVNLISVPKAIYVFQTCGLSLPHGTKCGAITVP
ncbi:putative lipid-transfer protein DIR1 [Neltuma alba]|uniref:putative lipid-transfer protein DIR1 n=1 Tax=Neltuma alba TaxID=207710 RepID=UPI0010A30362|nr:putative lipid-transfer protein DIR1 [Prosopis alba]